MLVAAPTTPYLPTPTVASPNIPTPQSGAYWLPQTANPSASMVPFYSTPTAFAAGASTLSSILGAYAVRSVDGRNNGEVITGNISIDPFLQ
jgi:hypothetical protein